MTVGPRTFGIAQKPKTVSQPEKRCFVVEWLMVELLEKIIILCGHTGNASKEANEMRRTVYAIYWNLFVVRTPVVINP